MANLQVFFNDIKQREINLKENVTTIGRDISSDVCIDNVGISGTHARVLKEGERFYIEDMGSQNGTYTKGQLITRAELNDGDTIAIFKHTLKFVAHPHASMENLATSNETKAITQATAPKGTVVADVSNVQGMLRQQQESATIQQGKDHARLVLIDHAGQRTHHLERSNLTFGKKGHGDLATNGWFQPPISATIIHKDDGYFLNPKKRGRVFLNRRMLLVSHRLKDGDQIQVRNLFMKFYLTIIKQ